MTLSQYIVDGGLPDGWTRQNLSWLAQTHWRFAVGPHKHRDPARAAWHRRWATFIEDVLASAHVQNH